MRGGFEEATLTTAVAATERIPRETCSFAATVEVASRQGRRDKGLFHERSMRALVSLSSLAPAWLAF